LLNVKKSFNLKKKKENLLKIKSIIKKKKNKFGNNNDTFEYTGTNLKKKPRTGNAGFFYEFTIPENSIFKTTGSKYPDVHLSIIDARGFAVPHMTFKPEQYVPNGISYHYGYKTSDSPYESFWITNNRDDIHYPQEDIKNELIKLFNKEIDNILVVRRDDKGNRISTYKFNRTGTIGRAPRPEQQRYAECVKYRKQLRNVLGPLDENRVHKRDNLDRNRRISGYTLPDPFSDRECR